MLIDTILETYPRTVRLRDGKSAVIRPLETSDEQALLEFFQSIPGQEVIFMKHRVQDPAVIQSWCQQIDHGRNLPLLAIEDDRIVSVCTLHQQLGGWKRHVGRISVLVRPDQRGRGLARALVSESIEIARSLSLEKLEAEFIGEQKDAMKVFALLGFINLICLPDYVRDMQAIPHDYILMGLDLKTDEEYAGMG